MEYYIIIACLGNVESAILLKMSSFHRFIQEERINNTIKQQVSIPKVIPEIRVVSLTLLALGYFGPV